MKICSSKIFNWLIKFQHIKLIELYFYFSALGNLGSVLSSQGRFDEARKALLEALKHRPNMADVHYNL